MYILNGNLNFLNNFTAPFKGAHGAISRIKYFGCMFIENGPNVYGQSFQKWKEGRVTSKCSL